MIIGIDTHVLIYAEAVPTKSGPKCHDFDDLRARAKLLIYKASDKGDTIVLPTVAISELLSPVAAGKRAALVQLLEKTFQCPPLDIPAATIAADLWSKFKASQQNQNGNSNSGRVVLRADALIVASARAANATHFYSHDSQCRTLAELAGMKGLDLPIATELDDHYLLADIRTGTVPDMPDEKKSAKGHRKKKKTKK